MWQYTPLRNLNIPTFCVGRDPFIMDCVDKHVAAWHIPRHVNGGGRHRGGLYSIWRQGGILCEKKAKIVKTKAFKNIWNMPFLFLKKTLVWYRMRASLNIIGHFMGGPQNIVGCTGLGPVNTSNYWMGDLKTSLMIGWQGKPELLRIFW